MTHKPEHAACVAKIIRTMIQESSMELANLMLDNMEGRRHDATEHHRRMDSYERTLTAILTDMRHAEDHSYKVVGKTTPPASDKQG